MATQSYRFDAPAECTIQIGPDLYHGGDDFELDESLAVDPRLTKVDPSAQSSESSDSSPDSSSDSAVQDDEPTKEKPSFLGAKSK